MYKACVSVSLRALSRLHFLINFHQNWHRRKNPERKNELVRGQYRTTPSPILPHKTPILGQKVLKPMQILSNPISALNVCESPKFSLLKGIPAQAQGHVLIVDWSLPLPLYPPCHEVMNTQRSFGWDGRLSWPWVAGWLNTEINARHRN